MLDINVKGTFFSFKYAATQLLKQGTGGRMIGAASVASKRGASPSASSLQFRPPSHFHPTAPSRLPAARGVLRVQVRRARAHPMRSNGLRQARHHR